MTRFPDPNPALSAAIRGVLARRLGDRARLLRRADGVVAIRTAAGELAGFAMAVEDRMLVVRDEGAVSRALKFDGPEAIIRYGEIVQPFRDCVMTAGAYIPLSDPGFPGLDEALEGLGFAA